MMSFPNIACEAGVISAASAHINIDEKLWLPSSIFVAAES